MLRRLLACPLMMMIAAPGCGEASDGGESSPQVDAATDPSVDSSDTPDAAGTDGPAPKDAAAEPPDLPKPLIGIYDISGANSMWGAYTGQAEIRAADDGSLLVVHLQQFSDAQFEGDQIALAWEGAASDPGTPVGPYGVSTSLDTVGFITSYKQWSRAGQDPSPIVLQASLVRTTPATLEGTFAPNAGPASLGSKEVWTWTSAPGPEPIWRNRRTLVAGHEPLSDELKATLFATYQSYHERPEVAPYVDRPEFNAAIHFFVIDPTDRDFYPLHPNVLRVIQHVPDPIRLVETRLRNRAFRQTLAQKAKHYDDDLPLHHLDESGMVSPFDPTAAPDRQRMGHMSSMLWTGVYMASQAMRYLVTQDDAALQNLEAGLKGQFLCHDIVGTPGQFARAVRVHVEEPGSGWLQGEGPYAAFDYLPNGNNDMLQGYFVGFAWAWRILGALPVSHDAERQRMLNIIEDLVAHHPEAGDHENNEFKARMLLYYLTKDIDQKLAYEGMFIPLKKWLVDQGNGPYWEYGASDWSGNHLILQGLLTPAMMSEQIKDGHYPEFRTGMRHALERMRDTRLGLFQLVTGALGDFGTAPPEVQQALDVLREFPAPKEHYAYDWTINPRFCMSPFPSLPWKADWATGPRLQSLVAYPAFEQDFDIFAFRSNPFGYTGGASAEQAPGPDYLFAYWFGRLYGVIDPQM